MEQQVSTKSLLTLLFNRLDALGIRYCVLHSYEQLPEHAVSDIDFAIDKRGIQAMDGILNGLATDVGVKLIQKMHYDIPRCYCYVLAYADGAGLPRFLQLDFHYNRWGVGRYHYLETPILLKDRRAYKNFYVPDPTVEAVYLILKRTIKENLNRHHKSYIEQLYSENRQAITELLAKYSGRRVAQKIERDICRGNWDRNIPKYQRCLQVRRLRNPWYILQFLGWQTIRVVKRFAHPTGMLVALIGPDGSGKTCVGDALCERMLGGFRRALHLHWRPGLLPPLSRLLRRGSGIEKDYTHPHRAEPYNSLVSLLRLLYYIADFIFGYWLKIQLLKVRSTLVVIDRYYYDLLVDTRRYRLKLPLRLMGALMKAVPKPDMVIYLHNSPENLYARKQEIRMEELSRQVRMFQKILPKLPNTYKVDTDRPLEEVVRGVTGIVLDFMAERLKHHLRGSK